MAGLNPERAAEPVVTHRGIVLATVTAALVIVTLDTTILNVAVPTIQRGLAEVRALGCVAATADSMEPAAAAGLSSSLASLAAYLER